MMPTAIPRPCFPDSYPRCDKPLALFLEISRRVRRIILFVHDRSGRKIETILPIQQGLVKNK